MLGHAAGGTGDSGGFLDEPISGARFGGASAHVSFTAEVLLRAGYMNDQTIGLREMDTAMSTSPHHDRSSLRRCLWLLVRRLAA